MLPAKWVNCWIMRLHQVKLENLCIRSKTTLRSRAWNPRRRVRWSPMKMVCWYLHTHMNQTGHRLNVLTFKHQSIYFDCWSVVDFLGVRWSLQACLPASSWIDNPKWYSIDKLQTFLTNFATSLRGRVANTACWKQRYNEGGVGAYCSF